MVAAAALARLHTFLAAAAFLSALLLGCALHFHKIVKNDVAGYPEEWFPSVSATIGDWFPERNLFQFLIALTSGPRFALVFLHYFLHRAVPSALPTPVFLAGLVRTLSCGGWVYVTSSDDHDLHDFMMVLYILANVPWMLGGAALAAARPSSRSVLRKRQLIAAGFFTTIGPLIYFFLQHKVHRIPGAYTRYAFFEWALIFFDVLYDSVAAQEFAEAGLQISLSTTAPPPAPIASESSAPADKIPSQDHVPPLPASTIPTTTGTEKSQPKSAPTPSASAPQHDRGNDKANDNDNHTPHAVDAGATSTPSATWRTALSFAADVYLSLVFWTLFTALIPSLFYFSVWKLGIAGHELALLAVLSPALLAMRLRAPHEVIFGSTAATSSPSNAGTDTGTATSTTPSTPPTLFAYARTRAGQRALHLWPALAGLGAYVVPSPAGRLLLVAGANAAGVVRAVVGWAGVVEGQGEGGGDVRYEATVFSLSVVLACVLKHANRANNPIWPFINHKADGYNNTGIVLALLAVYEYSTRPSPPPRTTPTPAPASTVTATPPPSPSTAPNPTLAALPLGALLFAVHSLLGDASTLVAWSWTGWAHRAPRGPMAHLHVGLTVLAMCVGVGVGLGLAGGVKPRTGARTYARHPAYLALGAGATYVMYAARGWKGYAGGLVVAVFVMAALPSAFEVAAEAASASAAGEAGVKPDLDAAGGRGSGRGSASETKKRKETGTEGDTAQRVARVYAMALGVYCVLNLASIFTVAYAFVPGGVYLRERTDLVLIAQTACLVPLFDWSIFTSLRRSKAVGAGASSTSTTSASTHTANTKLKLHTPHIITLLCILPLLALLTTLHRLPRAPPRPFKPGPRIVTAGIWAVHFGIDNEGHDSQRGMSRLIRDMELDIVGLLETDLHRTAFGSRDLSRLLVEESNYNVDIGPGPNAHTWGCVLLSKFPIISTTHHLLPSPHGELAPAIEAVLDIFGTEVLVIVSHNGQEEDPLDRELQATALAAIMAASTRPVIFLGYVVTKPHALRPSPYEIMVSDGNVHDIDADDLDRWCEYIFYRGLYRTSYARLSRGIITDTETQIGQFVLPKHGYVVTNDSVDARYRRSQKELLPVEHWFPMEYYGDAKRGGVNGHYYHVFGTPLYYRLPEDAIV